MKRGLIVLSIIFLAGCGLVTRNLENDINKWRPFNPENGRFSIRYPWGWHLITADPYLITSSGERLHGLGVPPSPGMWVEIAKGICNKESDDYVDSDSVRGREGYPSLLEKTICQDNFQVILGLWSDDPDIEEHKKILEKVASTFRAY